MSKRKCDDAASGSSLPEKRIFTISSKNANDEHHPEDSSNLQNENTEEDINMQRFTRSATAVNGIEAHAESSDVIKETPSSNINNVDASIGAQIQSNINSGNDASFQNQDAFQSSNQRQSLPCIFSNNQFTAIQPTWSYMSVNGAQIPYSPCYFSDVQFPYSLIYGTNSFQFPSNAIQHSTLRPNLSSLFGRFDNAISVPVHVLGSQFCNINSNNIQGVSSSEISGRVLTGHVANPSSSISKENGQLSNLSLSGDVSAQVSSSRLVNKSAQSSSILPNARNVLISKTSANAETAIQNVLPEGIGFSNVPVSSGCDVRNIHGINQTLLINSRIESCSTPNDNGAFGVGSSNQASLNINIGEQQMRSTSNQSGIGVPISGSSNHSDPIPRNFRTDRQDSQHQQNLDNNLDNNSRDNVSFFVSPNIQNGNARVFLHSDSNNATNQNNSNIVNNGNVNSNNIDSSMRLAQALESSLGASRVDSSRLYTRISATKNTLQFSGDPLDWPRFKQAFLVETQVGDYSEAENVIRLYGILKGEVLNETKSLFATGHTCEHILKALEMRFGCPKIIVQKVVNEIRDLPSLETGKVDLIEFASKLKNSVAAIKALNEIGHLYSPDLAKETLKKLPSPMLSNYIKEATSLGREKSDYEKISIFLYKEAEAAIEAGIFDIFRTVAFKKILTS